MKSVDTLSPARDGGYLRPTKLVNDFRSAAKNIFGSRLRWNEPEPTALPEGFDGGEGFDTGITTVEGLRDAYNGFRSRKFTDYLGDDAKADPDITRYKTGEDFYKGFKEQSKLVGAKGVVIPDENSDDGVKSAYRKALGIPEAAEGYNFAELEGLHPEVKITPEVVAGFKAFAHKHSLSAKQAEGIFPEYFGMVSDGFNKRDETAILNKNESIAALRNDWGKDFDQNSTIARRLVEKFGGKEVLAEFGDLGNKPKIMKFLSNLGKTISEDGFVGIGSQDLSTDATGAKGRIKEIEADPDFMDQSKPKHKALVDERTALYKVAYPNEG